MSESSIQSTSPEIKPDIIQHSDITLVFGQGPVQEYSEKQSEAGRTGLNFFSRLNALAAAEMLIQGKTETVILSGGATGAKQQSTEADLLADIINKRVQNALSASTDTSQQNRLSQILQNGIKIENRSKDSVQNFVNILNDYIDSDSSDTKKTMTLLGISFHSEDTYSGAGVGRLKKLAEIFDVEGQVLSSEDVLTNLTNNNRTEDSFVVKELQRLADLSKNHEVSQGKSKQEGILVELLDHGDWLADGKGNIKIDGIKNPARLKHMLQSTPFVTEQLMKARNITMEQASAIILNIDTENPQALEQLQTIVNDVAPLVKEDETYKKLQSEYGKVKSNVLESYEDLRNQRIRSLLNKPELTDDQIQEKIETARIQASSLRNDLRELTKQIETALTNDQRTRLIEQRVQLLQQLDPLHNLLLEDKYEDRKTYLMMYGKGEDPRKKTTF